MRARNVKSKTADVQAAAEPTADVQSNRTKEEKPRKLRYGPLGLKHEHKAWSRAVLFTGVLVIALVFKWRKSPVVTWVSQKPIERTTSHSMACASGYAKEIARFEGCALARCSRHVTDDVVASEDADVLRRMFVKGLAFGGSSGGASILDLHSGALSKDDRFINIKKLKSAAGLWTADELAAYVRVKDAVLRSVAERFGVGVATLHLAEPTFFSRITDRPAATLHDEYWHPHVDKETYETFHFTALVYLSDYGVDFTGGRFLFIDRDGFNRTVEPRKGRVSMFTSGAENLHAVEKVASGTRYALTVAFTCDAARAIADPQFP